jgi:hypothetical protein
VEVFEGTISDAMLPLDSVRSQAPRAQPEVVGGQPAGGADTGSEEAAASAEEPAPASEEAYTETP